jgi:hypothetical protein
MGSFKTKTAITAMLLVMCGALGVVSAYAVPNAKSPTAFCASGQANTKAKPCTKVAVCALDQQTAKAKPCTANADLGKPGCMKFESSVRSITGIAPSSFTAFANSAVLDCEYTVDGKSQAFSIRAFGDVPLSQLTKGFRQDVAEAATLSCAPVGGTGSTWPASPPVMITGLGNSAYEWDVCQPPGEYATTEVDVLDGSNLYVVEGQYPAVSVTVSQLETFIRQLMTMVK